MKLLDAFSFHHSLEDTRGTALAVFTAPHCGSCDMMRDALATFGRDHPEVLLFEVDAQRDMALTQEFEVFDLPALFLYLDGRFHGEIQCEALPEKIAAAVADARAAPAEEAP